MVVDPAVKLLMIPFTYACRILSEDHSRSRFEEYARYRRNDRESGCLYLLQQRKRADGVE